MIAFDLKCAQGHQFEGWFDSGDDFDDQRRRGLVSCPVCGDGQVSRMLAAVRSLKLKEAPATEAGQKRAVLKAIKKFVDDNFENVGPDFAKEALKIHYGVSESRNIRGSSSEEEEKMLRQEGVTFFKLPVPARIDET